MYGIALNKTHLKLQILVFAIEIVNNKFSQYTIESVLKLYNYGLSKAYLAGAKLTTIKNISKN